MFKLEYADMQALSDSELRAKALGFKKQLMIIRFQTKLGDAGDKSAYSKVKKSIARILTEMSARKCAALNK